MPSLRTLRLRVWLTNASGMPEMDYELQFAHWVRREVEGHNGRCQVSSGFYSFSNLGILTTNVEPRPGSLRTSTVPPCSSTIVRTI